MMKFLIILGLVLILFACDRFDHKFEPIDENENSIIDFFDSFADSIATFPANIPGIMSFYHDDFSNNGMTKQDMENFYWSFTLVNMPIALEATLIDTTDNYEIDWRLLATELSGGATFMDTIFTDVLLPTDESFLFYGNQADLRNVIVELFTGQWCPNCPNAEDALHNLRMQYGSRFSYVEYHFNDQLALDNSPIFYYPFIGTLPFGIVNGNAQLIYSAPSVEYVQTEIENAILPLLQEPILIKLSDVQTTLTDTLLTGSVLIELDPSVSTSNLTLVAVLMENYNDEYLNNHGEPHHNIALKRATFDISTANLENPVEFEIPELADLPQWYINNATGLPEDLTLVLWVQIIEPSYNENTCSVYNVIEIPL